jgi:hypothetical protein
MRGRLAHREIITIISAARPLRGAYRLDRHVIAVMPAPSVRYWCLPPQIANVPDVSNVGHSAGVRLIYLDLTEHVIPDVR